MRVLYVFFVVFLYTSAGSTNTAECSQSADLSSIFEDTKEQTTIRASAEEDQDTEGIQ